MGNNSKSKNDEGAIKRTHKNTRKKRLSQSNTDVNSKSKRQSTNTSTSSESDDITSDERDSIKIVPGLKLYSTMVSDPHSKSSDKELNVETQLESRSEDINVATQLKPLTKKMNIASVKKPNDASIPDKKFGSLRFYSNNPLCKENSPDETGQTVPLTRGGEKIHIFSSSMCRDISETLLNDQINSGTARIHLHRGRKSDEIRKHVKEHSISEQTDCVVIIAGGNDMSTSRSPETTAETLINTGVDCVEADVPPEKVCISRVLPRKESCLLYTSPSPRDRTRSRMPSSA